MAKRRTSGEMDPFDVPFEDELDEIEVDVSDFRLEDSADVNTDLLESVESQPTSAPLSIGQVIGGTLQVIVIAALVLAVFLAIGFGAVYGGQRLGIIPMRASGASSTTISLLPTQVAQQPTQAGQPPPTTAPLIIVPTAVPALPTLTPDPTCSVAATWWNSQQVRDNYQYFTVQALEDANDQARRAALLEQMRIRREFVANFPADPCLNEARDALLRGFDATIETARAVGNPAAFSQQQATQAQAFAALTAALWAVNVNVDADSAPAQSVARDSGAACGAQVWYDSVKAHQQAFFTTVQQIDLTTMSASAVRPLLDTMQVERGNVAMFAVPVCTVKAQALLLGALDSYSQALEQQIAARSASIDLTEYTRQNALFMAWLDWLGVS